MAYESALPLFTDAQVTQIEAQVTQMEAWYKWSPMIYPDAEHQRRSDFLPSTTGKGKGQGRLVVEDRPIPPLPERFEITTRASSTQGIQEK